MFKSIALKTVLVSSLTFAVFSTAAQAATLKSKSQKVNVARVVQVMGLGTVGNVEARLVIQDLGGSTDVSPTQRMYVTLYMKGEMFSTDATFDLGSIYGLTDARLVKPGVVEIKFIGAENDKYYVPIVKTVDLRKAIRDMSAVECGDNFDCDASTNFSSTIEVK